MVSVVSTPGTHRIIQVTEGPVTRVNLGRLTNCIFVFTLLYLFKNIQVPNIMDQGTGESLSSWLMIALPEILNFINAYLIIAIIWILSFHIIHQIRIVTHWLLYLHFGMLMALVYVPVSSLLADDFPNEPLFSFILHLNILAITIFLCAEWVYAGWRGILIQEHPASGMWQATPRRLAILLTTALIGSILSLMNVQGSRFLYMIVLIILSLDAVITDQREWKHHIRRQDSHGAGVSTQIFTVPATTKGGQTNETPGYRGPVGQDMLEILMNGMFAFSMTLIVKNIPLPKVADAENIDVLINFFIRVFIDTVEFVLIFIILSLLWILSFEIMRRMRAVDLSCVYLTLTELFLIVFIPVTSSVLIVFSDETHTSMIFGINIILLGALQLGKYHYIIRRQALILPEFSHERETETARPLRTIPQSIRNRLNLQSLLQKGHWSLDSRITILPLFFGIWIILDLGNFWFAPLATACGVYVLVRVSGDGYI